jgi:hypothetical protein
MKKAQLQAMEPIIIVIVLAVIIGVGLLFYTRINDNQQREDRIVAYQQEDLVLLSRIARMPELSCSNDESLTNCIDAEKAKAFATVLRTERGRLHYYSFFGDANVTITSFDLETGTLDTQEIYGGLDAESYTPIVMYFTLYDPKTDISKMATLTVLRRAG